MKYSFVLLFSILVGTSMQSQIDTLQVLPEVVLSDALLKNNSTAAPVIIIPNEIFATSRTALTDVLATNTLIYFKENGPGGVSSPSFRGTNAQQTAVIWNGININSQLTGQTDFNTILSKNYDQISVRSGGGSIIYGSGAVGGSIHLQNKVAFDKGITTDVTAGYASFDTKIANAKTTISKDLWTLDFGVDYISSANDFKYLETAQYNENGAYENMDLALNAGYRIPSSLGMHVIKLHHNTYFGDRNFSGTLTAPSNDAYKDANTRSLLSWEHTLNSYKGRFHAAHLYEQFKYFGNNAVEDNYSIGKSSRFLAKYDALFQFDTAKHLTLSGEINSIRGSGTSIATASRTVSTVIALWKHLLSDRFKYEVQARQEFIAEYKSPFLVGVGLEYAFAKAKDQPSYILSLQASHNYRVPTFNDRYWEGAGAIGNPNIEPESSMQIDFGQRFYYRNLQLGLNGYYIRSRDLIKWQPNTSGIWTPVNISKSNNYGAEISGKYKWVAGKHHIKASMHYGYTVAKDGESNNRLIYVPLHKTVAHLSHTYKQFELFVQSVGQSSVFTTSDNRNTVDGYYLLHTGLVTKLINTAKRDLSITIKVNNIMNTNYQTVAFRPNPGRNFLIQTNYIF